MKYQIKKGTKFGRLIVISDPISFYVENRKQYKYIVKCDCGIQKSVHATSLFDGYAKSCGCLNKELSKSRMTTHGMGQTRFYKTYSGMKYRCGKEKNYKIIKCLWNSFEEFKKDMYSSYLRHQKKYGINKTTIDRINSNGDYSKDNCRWLDMKGQNRNRNNNYLITFNNKTKTLQEWSEDYKIKRLTLRYRLKAKWPVKLALETPVLSSNRFKNLTVELK